ncbi:MAG: hypothetical protein AMXMBFR46_09600 [Acidimicrobiia bacterium]
MRTVRRLGGLAVVLVLVLVTLGGTAATAGAQQGTFTCGYTVGPTRLPPGGGFVTVSGTGPGSSVARIFVDGQLRVTTPTAPGTGFFSAQVFITGSSEISVALDDYPNTPCIGTGGSGSGQVPGISDVVLSRGGLAHTGASGVERGVLLGLAAIGLGLVIVTAVRRRTGAAGRA